MKRQKDPKYIAHKIGSILFQISRRARLKDRQKCIAITSVNKIICLISTTKKRWRPNPANSWKRRRAWLHSDCRPPTNFQPNERHMAAVSDLMSTRKRVENVHSPTLRTKAEASWWRTSRPRWWKLRKRQTETATRAATSTKRAALRHGANLRWKHSAMRENLQSICENFTLDKKENLSVSWRDKTDHSAICPFRAWRQRFPPFLLLPPFGCKGHKAQNRKPSKGHRYQKKISSPVEAVQRAVHWAGFAENHAWPIIE